MDGKELKKLRTKFGYTLRSFGQKVGLSHMAIQYYERDERTITETVERQIKQALGLSFDIKQDCDLHVHLDYLRLTFFDTSVETIGSKVIGIDLSYFTMQEKNINNYKRVYSCGMIKLYWSDDPKQGIMLELSGQGLKELEDHLEELGFTLIQWLLVVLDEDYFLSNHYYSRVQSSRIDLAIDEMWNEENGNYDIHDLQEKYQRGLVETRLETYDPRETEKRGEKQGLTIYWGSDTGDFKIRMYEKAKERATKENKDYYLALQEYGIVNRYEMELHQNYAEHALNRIVWGESLNKIAIDLLLSKISVYEEQIQPNGKVTMNYAKDFYEVFGEFKKTKVNGKIVERTLEKTFRWFERQVASSLAMLRAIYGEKWLFDWLTVLMDNAEINQEKQNIINGEMAEISPHDNPVFLFWDKKVKERERLNRSA